MAELEKNMTEQTPAPAPKPKKPTMQDEADALFEMQMRIAKEAKKSDISLIGIFLAFIFAFAILIYAIPDKAFSEQENRVLQQFPQIQSRFNGSLIERIRAGKFLDKYFNGDFSEGIADYYADQFPARDFFVGLKGVAEIAMLKGENNDIVLGKDGYLLTKEDAPNLENVEKNYNASLGFAQTMQAEGVDVVFAAAGRVIDIMQNKLPALFPVGQIMQPWDTLNGVAAEDTSGAMKYVDLQRLLLTHADQGEYVMYRTDHHWTTYGAYLAYAAIMESFGMEALPLETFEVEQVSGAFYGTAWRNAGMKWIEPDAMEFYRYAGDEDFTMTIHDSDTVMKGFYDRSYLEKTDQYSSFISGNNAYVTIEKDGGEERERLMLVKDSFGHSLAPFLAYHFDLEIVDLRYYRASAAQLVRDTGCSRVLIINNMGSLTDAATLSMLAIG